MVATGFSWSSQPDYVRLFILYLFFVGAITIAYSAQLIYRLYYIRLRISHQNIFSDPANASLVARSALAYNSTHVSPTVTEPRRSFLILEEAISEFDFLWESCNSRAVAIERLSILTFLLTFLVFAGGAFPTWSAEYNNTNIPGFAALLLSTQTLFLRLAWGLATSSALYVLSSFFLGVLQQRRTHWRRFATHPRKPEADGDRGEPRDEKAGGPDVSR